ncbi:type VI secretion system ImpA family N-terminal domain-containing protein [Pseudomonas sp. YJ42]|uniref:type VI secretion system ImpA family N-terminal domain-containing protein n=1 Tax=Pseudomonas sp. YJ42 TaxID=3392115 RepID=UPI0039A15B45
MTFSSKLAVQVLAAAKSPITASCFAGDDIRYAAEYELLEQELGKAASLHAAGAVDWEAMRAGSESLLSTQTKDLRIAAWLTWSLYQRDSFLGLHAGLAMLGFFCRDHWEDIHPRKDRTRAAAINWLVPRMEQVLADHVPMGEQLPLFEQIAIELRSLESCLATRLGSQAPLLLPLCRRLEEMVKRAGAAHPQPGAVGAAIAQVKQAAVQVFTATTPVEHEKDAHKSLRSLQDQARPLCSWWLKQKATDLRPLRLRRLPRPP